MKAQNHFKTKIKERNRRRKKERKSKKNVKKEKDLPQKKKEERIPLNKSPWQRCKKDCSLNVYLIKKKK